METCIFCKIINEEIKSNIIYQDDKIISFLDIEPINEGHILIVPKIHVLDLDEIEDDLINYMIGFAKKMVRVLKNVYNLDGYSIMQNGGIFNDIGHFHLHLFPRYKNDGFSWNCRVNKNDLNETASKIRDILEN